MEEWQKIAEGNTAEIFLFSHEKGVKQFKCGYSQKSSSGQIQRQADKAASYSHVICLSLYFYFIIISLSDGSGLSGADGRAWYQ